MTTSKNREVIKKYLQSKNLTQREFAFILDVSEVTITHWMNGRKMNPSIAKKIQEKTNGEIKIEDLYVRNYFN